MRFLYLIAVLFAFGVGESLRAGDDHKTLLVHYMPWFKSKPVSGRWGWHWTMNRFNPEKIDKNRQREIAAYDYPLFGPYDSNDPDLLECHVLLMKLAGIDGVIIDWYGIAKFRDYASIHRNTLHLIKHIKKAGLSFAICYEDQTVKHMIDGKFLKPQTAIAHGKQTLTWLDQNWFVDRSYIKFDGRPVLLVFGPQYFKKQQWRTMLSRLTNRPRLFALPHLSRSTGADGAFGWPPVVGGKEIPRKKWLGYLSNLDSRRAQGESIISVAFPGFRDIYQQAGLHESYGFIDANNGATFNETLKLAWNGNSPLIQIATWNDHGEGTSIEPTKRFGYWYLETIQDRVNSHRKTKKLRHENLRLPVGLYRARKNLAGDRETLDRASQLLFESKCSEAKAILATLNESR